MRHVARKFALRNKALTMLMNCLSKKHLLEELVNSGLYGTKDNFAVVVQPALQVPPKAKVRVIYSAQCFH